MTAAGLPRNAAAQAVVRFGTVFSSGEMSPGEVAAITELTIDPADEFEIVSCQVTILKGGVMYNFRLNSAALTEEVRKFTGNLQNGDKLFVDQILVRSKTSKQTQRLPAITVKVK